MAVTFAWRSDTSTGKAWHSKSNGELSAYRYGVTATGGVDFLSATSANVIGTRVFDLGTTSGRTEMCFVGRENADFSAGKISGLVRYVPNYNGNPSANFHILNVLGPGKDGQGGPALMLVHRTTGPIECWIYDPGGTARYTGNAVAAYSATSGNPADIFFTMQWDTTNTASFYMNAVLQTSTALSWTSTFDAYSHFHEITAGYNVLYGAGGGAYNEIVVWNTLEDPTSINTVTPGGTTTTGDSLDGITRDGWVDVAQLDGVSSTDPGVANVLSGTGYTINGNSLTGTYATPAYTDPGIANVREDTNYIFNDSTLTGTLTVPTAVDGTSTTINIPNIKEQVRYVLASNNTTTSSVLDLSASMSKRVQSVWTVNPEKIIPQASMFPGVTIWTKSKSVSNESIAKNQVSGKRMAKLTLGLAGMVWNQNGIQANRKNDAADDDCERLMENMEKILRHYHTLGNTVDWQIPREVIYHNASFDEKTHFRVGLLDIELTIKY